MPTFVTFELEKQDREKFNRFEEKYNADFLFEGERLINMLVSQDSRQLFAKENLEDLDDLLYNVDNIRVVSHIAQVSQKDTGVGFNEGQIYYWHV